MEDYKLLYENLLADYNRYQSNAEMKIQELSKKNINMENKLNSISNIVEIGKYINSSISNEDFILKINDLIVGILGSAYSAIYLVENYNNSVANIRSLKQSKYVKYFQNNQEFRLNSATNLNDVESKKEIHSAIGAPIIIRGKMIGYIVAEHTHINFFTDEHMKLLRSITTQVAIALENYNLYKKVEELAIEDPLLSIYNRRFLYNEVERKIRMDKSKRFAIVMLDIDNFKKVNDTYGHQFGDNVLIYFADKIKEHLNRGDVLARYGGEEIIMYINDAHDAELVYNRMEKMRQDIVNDSMNIHRITASIGISFYPDNGDKLDDVIAVSDKMLYRAKEIRKNIVVSSMKQ